MKYKIVGMEWHDPSNYDSEQELLDLFPNSKVIGRETDNWILIEWYEDFEADNLQEAKDYIMNHYDLMFLSFNLINEKGETVWTEDEE